MAHFQLSFVKGVNFCPDSFFVCLCTVVLALFVGKIVIALLCHLCCFVNDKLTISGLSTLFSLIHLSIVLPLLCVSMTIALCKS